MNIIVVGRNHGKSRTVKLGNVRLAVMAFVMAGMMAAIFVAGFMVADSKRNSADQLDQQTINAWKNDLKQQALAVSKIKNTTQAQIDALTLRMGNMAARLLRLDALGQRLTKVAKLGNGEFDFHTQPALGGPVDTSQPETSYSMSELQENLARIEEQIKDREQQLDVIDTLFVNRNIKNERFIAGRPIKHGWLSSHYGYRTDPFTGKRAWHSGTDFAGKLGSNIVAVASGVVTWAGDRYGYGNLVEINHGGGYSTRYGHCKKLLVKVGDVVKKGQVIAKMGSTGRSTGPHVHYEVLKAGKSINPEKYIFRASL
jgi:murein DD-endopeptidase MepM/ murein hydrolase activator NlpD